MNTAAISHPGGHRWLVRIVALLILAAAALTVQARPAAADICKDAPAPIEPKSGLPGLLTSRPKDIPDQAPDPFADTSVPIGDVYGYNWQWSNYDLGCGNDFLRDPVAVTNTKSGNVVLSFVGMVPAGVASLEQMARTSSLAWLTTVITGIADKLRTPVLAVWLPLALLGVGVIIGVRARRASYSDTLRTLIIITGAISLAVFALAYPTIASRTADKAVVAVADAAGSQFPHSSSDAINRESAYRTWLAGNFGDPDSQVAKDLGPRLMAATHYSWSDIKRIQADPDAKDDIDDAKADEFKKIANELEDRNEGAYDTFTGRGERTGPALFGMVLALCMSFFVIVSMIMVLVARLMMQGLALAAPLAAVIGILPTHTFALARVWDLFTAALLAVAKFVIAGGVMTMVLAAIETNDDLAGAPKLFWIVVATVVGIVLTHPVRSFKTIVPGMDPNRSYIRTIISGVASYLGARAGAEDGQHDDGEDESSTQTKKTTTARPSPDARESLPALPAPQWQSADQTSSVRVIQTEPTQPPTTATAPEENRVWPGVVTAPRAAELPAASARISAVPEPALAITAGTTSTTENDRQADTSSESGSGGSSGTEADHGSSTVTPDVDRPRSNVPAENGSEVVYPTGIIVADDESPLYRRSESDDGRSRETYVPMGDLELAQDGSEHDHVTYHSGAGHATP
ncbi:hypothetical protein FOE78_01735 [Microlunatus elymi]|uniref:TrbL/VirB6 plasmid conjugal transfer protein n=1 Tax=Microlunatus elymi TaxID=2596828 RepID=A0A516PUE4_9ACTN|nr:hypothetical protein [Microlunatus elymi]QDP94808.1 hypothetical protein FOE78_01735 [Microlunatus elymi]